MSITSINEKYGIGVCAVFIAVIWAGIFTYMAGLQELGLLLTTAGGIAGGAVGAVQTMIICNQKA